MIISLKKASARVIADNFFDNYISRFGAPIKLISDNDTQFISDIFENFSERLGIRPGKTVVYRRQANRTERVNRDHVQMIGNYVNDQHNKWDQFLREFAYAIRTAVNETTEKTPPELFLGRKLITPLQKLVMVSVGTEFAVRIYRHRKCDETEIGPGSSDNESLRDESSGFDRVQRRSNESQDGKKKGSEKSRKEETVTPTTSGYNLRPRNGKKVDSRSTIERKTQQGGPVRSRKGRGRNDSPYIEERTRSSNKNARRGGDQQWQDQERKGACTRKSISLEVLVGNANYKS
ncbi:uncharacterized protein TNCV_2487851 [Trichonephila clavipes]|uniref:Integrase catalytic domain-containing protein n=1 Tax=Trichonephila clavipes TaxID=2585209 RepID=A0A8X7BB80_TRICX|nr:uncharacterized protein TNCV_2487851 [Trichonephila clavipes]